MADADTSGGDGDAFGGGHGRAALALSCGLALALAEAGAVPRRKLRDLTERTLREAEPVGGAVRDALWELDAALGGDA